jgi:hypothetical protein
MIATHITRTAILTIAVFLTTSAFGQAKPAPNTLAKGKSSALAPATLSTAAAPQVTIHSFPPVNCTQDHPGESERSRDVVMKGDSHMSKAVSTHVVKYAIQRFRLDSYVTPADIARAENEMYSFLKWKLGNPTAIAGQFVTAGYQHFDRAFSYEAAVALVGSSLPQETKPEFAIPKDDVDKLKADAQKDGSRLEVYLQKKYQIPPEYSDQVVQKLVEAAQGAVSHLGFNMPKSWAIDENVALVLIGEKMSGTHAPAKVAAVSTSVR